MNLPLVATKGRVGPEYRISNSNMEFFVPSTEIDYPVTIRWTGDDAREYWSDYCATFRRDGRLEGGLPVMEMDITPYILTINRNPLEGGEDEGSSSMGSIDERLTRKRKRADDDEDGPEAKRM